MKTVASVGKALHFCASALVFASLLCGLFPETTTALGSPSAATVLGHYAEARNAAFSGLGRALICAIGRLRHWTYVGLASDFFVPPPALGDAIIFFALQIPAVFPVLKAAGRIEAAIDRWKDKRGRRAALLFALGFPPWRALAARLAMAAVIAALISYYLIAYGAGAFVFLAACRGVGALLGAA